MKHPLGIEWSGHIKVGGPNGNHYWAVKCPNHPKAWKNGYIYEHRIFMECRIGRLLEEDEIVHHKNEIKRDNNISNLELVTRATHGEHHRSGRTFQTLTCAECKANFQRETRLVHDKNKNHFCSYQCNGKFQRRLQPRNLWKVNGM